MLRVARHLLSDNDAQRHGQLRDYFCDKDAKATPEDGAWRLELDWPGGRERHVDPRIEAHLPALGVGDLSQMALFRRSSGRMMTTLYDTWTLLAWSEWAKRSGARPGDRITILHLDDHRDLAAPRLATTAVGYEDLITGAAFDVLDPSSVKAACESGAVGMGSFLTPFLLRFPECDVRQLGQAPKITATTDSVFRAATVEDDLLRPGVGRPAIALEPTSGGPGPGRYRATDHLGHWLSDIEDGPVLLHVDMDYFNNRYDGDGDWLDRRARHDPPIEMVLRRVDEVTAAIREAGLLHRIGAGAVAFSPGFFPAEMWHPAEERLRAGLEELYG